MVTPETLIETACLQYTSSRNFKSYVDEQRHKLSMQGTLVHEDIKVFFEQIASTDGRPVAYYMLEWFENAQQKQPHSNT